MKMQLISLLCVLCISSLYAQAPFQHRCAYDHAVQHFDNKYPGYKQQADALFQEAARWAADNEGNRSSYTIPLAVHVVWKDSSQNLPECKIIEQVNILNAAYQRMNADTVNLRPVFDGVVGNPSIAFRLDTIIWKSTTTDFFAGGILPDLAASDQVKHDSSGGSNALPTSGHLNIWICNLGDAGLLGYAYPPAGLSNWPANSQAPTAGDDGVVLDYRTVGADNVYANSNLTINTQGRAGIHEVGHYLGLRHIWGDGLLSILGIPDCSADDGLTDTPNAGIPSNYQCDPNQNTCDAGAAGDLPDMIENFMDYSEESCQNSFTLQQIGIMHGVLNVERNGLLNTPAPSGAARPSNDALPNALTLQVNTDQSCSLFTSANNSNASQSMTACVGNVANDVWFSFEATSDGLIVNFNNVSAVSGSGTDLVYELFSGSCGNLQSLGCSSSASDTLSGLVADNYFIRVYSNDPTSSQSFDLCLQSYGQVIAGQTMAAVIADDITVYPNPSSGILNVSIPTHSSFEGSAVLRNVLGQQISNPVALDAYSGELQLDLSTIENGMYVLELIINDERFVKKIILNK